jgi:hypothetical protein
MKHANSDVGNSRDNANEPTAHTWSCRMHISLLYTRERPTRCTLYLNNIFHLDFAPHVSNK